MPVAHFTLYRPSDNVPMTSPSVCSELRRRTITSPVLMGECGEGVRLMLSAPRLATFAQHPRPEDAKQNGHLLALTFERSLRGEDLLGEVFRGVGLRAGELGCRGSPQRCGALAAELIPRRVCCATRRTRRGKRVGALSTELRARRILVLALRTLHGEASQRAGPGT